MSTSSRYVVLEKVTACFRMKTSRLQCPFAEMSHSKRLAVLRLSLALRTKAAAAPALWERAVRTAVVVIAWLVPHEAFKGSMIAIREIHQFPPFEFGLGLAVYIEEIRFMVKRFFSCLARVRFSCTVADNCQIWYTLVKT